MNKIGLLLPAYNEEKNLPIILKDIKEYLPSVEVVVIDDGSFDKTSEIAIKNNVKLIRHKQNKGKAEAIKTGLKYFLKEKLHIAFIVIADADRQYLIKEITKIFKPLEKDEADFVTGYRNWSKVPFRHKLGNFVWRTFFNILFGTGFKDTNCGYVGLNKKAAEIMKENIYGGYILENSMFILALKNNLKIKQVPVTVLYKKISKVPRGIRIVLGVLLFIFKEGFKYRLGIK